MEEEEEEKGDVFSGRSDRFRGVTVSSAEEPCAEADFEDKLVRSIEKWKEQGVRGVWFKVSLSESAWVPALVRSGFDFHHASAGSVSLVRWLPEDEPHRIPPYAHHMVGVGGVVLNDADEVLVVMERFSPVRQWKLPGGYVDPSEDFPDAAVREVKEETGVDTEFDSLISLRHAHGFNFGCSDIYVVALLRPKTTTELVPCRHEISDCRWMPVAEFLTHPDVHETNRHFARKVLEGREGGVTVGVTEIELRFKEFRRRQMVYSIQKRERNKIRNVFVIDGATHLWECGVRIVHVLRLQSAFLLLLTPLSPELQ